MNELKLTEEDWQAGFDAGRRREPDTPPQGVEVMSWISGYIEGKAQPWNPAAGSQGGGDHIESDGPRC